MDLAQTTAALAAIISLFPVLVLATAGAAKLAASFRPPGSRWGGILVVLAALNGAARPAHSIAAVTPVAAREVPTPTTEPPPTAATVVSSGYAVQPGDSLWAIACRHLRAAGADPAASDVDRMWRSIYEANRHVIGDDPDLIFPGTRLTIPEERA